MLRFAALRSEKRLSLAIASGLFLTAFCPRSLPARELTSEVESLFELGEKSTPPAVAAAKAHYERLKRDYPRDRRVDYAYGVALLNQHRYLEALAFLTSFRADGLPDVAVSQTKIWALVQGRQVAEAIREMVTLSQSLNEAGDRNPGSESNDQTARFIGGIFGYLDLVRPGVVEHELRSKQRNVVLNNLGDRYTPMYDSGHAAVAQRFAELKADRKLAQERTTASHTARLDRDKAALDDDRGKIANNEEAMQSHLENVRDAQRELNVVRTQLDTLQADRTRLGAQIVTVQAQISVLQPRIPTALVPQGNGYTGPVARATTRAGTFTAEFAQVAVLSLSLGQLYKQAFEMDRRLLSLQQRSAELSDRSWRDTDSLYQHDAAAQRTAKRAKAMEKKLNRESMAPKASTAALTSQMTALSTYLPFPYEQERKRVLAWFEK